MNVASPESPSSPARRSERQPDLGLLGLVFVVPIAALLSVGAGAERSTLVLAPLITFALPLVAMVAFWWAGWPGTRWLPAWGSGWSNTALIALGAVVLTGAGQAVVGSLHVAAVFDPSPAAGQVPTFPATLPLGGAVFVVMLQITLVGEGWPLHRLHPLPAGLLALVASWAVALVLYFTVVRVDPPAGSGVDPQGGLVDGADFGGALILIAAWQVLVCVLWRGWPFGRIATRRWRLSTAHLAVVGGGSASYLLAHEVIGLDAVHVVAGAGCFIAAALLVGMMFDNWLPERVAAWPPVVLPASAAVVATLLGVLLYAAAGALRLARVSAADWVEHASLNALSTSIILHVAIGRRWPFAATHP